MATVGTDKSGVTTVAHETKHVKDLMHNVPYSQIVATDTSGTAEAYGAAIAASPEDMSQQEAEAYVASVLEPREPPQRLTDVSPPK